MRDHKLPLGNRALVIGGSIGGLLAARVLSDAYDEVLVVDRDRFGPYGEYRKGVLQARHAHGLLAGGQRAMEDLLPGLTAELEARGAISSDLQGRCIWVNEGYELRQEPTGLRGLLTNRLLLEDQIRNRVAALPGVVLRERCDVLGLVVDAQGRIAGARVRWRDREDASDGGEEEVLAADLVVDASGRGSRSPVWLQALGWGLPPKDEIVVGLSYTTFELGRTTPDPDAVSLVVGATVDRPRGGVLLAQPDGRWVATLGGYLGDAAPTDLEGFRRFAAGMPSPRVAEALEELTPIGPARTFKYHASTWRRYDRMRRFPDGFLVFGDAICSFNPIFGQGMTVAAREALALRDCLRRQGTARLARRFFTAARREIANPWEIAASSDLRLPAVLGRRTAKVRMTNAYLPHYFRAAQHDVGLGLDFLRVVNLLARPESLLSPTRMARVVGRRDRSPSTARTAETRVPAERPDAA